MSETGEVTVPVTNHPFTKASADIILRSSDGIDFRVHTAILSEASPVFEGMMTLPQPDETLYPKASGSSARLVPYVDLPETSGALDGLLRMCYPLEDPIFDSPRDAEGALAAAIKYDMGGIVARGCAQLEARCVPERPSDVLDVFVVASRLGLHSVLKKAARVSLYQTFGRALPEELKSASREAIFQLLDYRRRVQAAAVAIIVNPRFWTFYRTFGPLAMGGDGELTISDWGFPWSVRHWAILPMAYCKDEDHECPPYGDESHGFPEHIRIDRPEVFSDILGQLGELPPLPESLDTPEVLLREVLTKANCNDCRINALKYFRRFFSELRDTIVTGALLDVEFEFDGMAD